MTAAKALALARTANLTQRLRALMDKQALSNIGLRRRIWPNAPGTELGGYLAGRLWITDALMSKIAGALGVDVAELLALRGPYVSNSAAMPVVSVPQAVPYEPALPAIRLDVDTEGAARLQVDMGGLPLDKALAVISLLRGERT